MSQISWRNILLTDTSKKPPEKYRFLGYYQFRQKQRDFMSNFRLEAQRLRKCLWFLSEYGSDVEKRATRRLLDNFEASILFYFILFFVTFQTPLADSMEGPVKSREGVNTSMTMVDACVPSTLWCHSLSRHGPQSDCIISCGGGVLQESREGNHRRKNKDINQFWNEVELLDDQFMTSPKPAVTGEV
ncbi:hypothetical protein BC938DRAFT_481433 [Jimgerdemannia flammicorona]|uniref:Uncharacterized protein n=1 Tax=Jimgerdemannia flammicorona TaxID=994334 RepID=A0A433QG56_9FUNG|nr:hypothetical protein BC938DRAFT_481433 [Jimgerdemannia flammicorona]